jgi:hypothetical protein
MVYSHNHKKYLAWYERDAIAKQMQITAIKRVMAPVCRPTVGVLGEWKQMPAAIDMSCPCPLTTPSREFTRYFFVALSLPKHD